MPKKSEVESHKTGLPSNADEGLDSPPYEAIIASTPSSSIDAVTSAAEAQIDEAATKVAESELRHQVEDRPLQQAQARMEAQHVKDLEEEHQAVQEEAPASQGSAVSLGEEAVLKEDDRELDRILKVSAL